MERNCNNSKPRLSLSTPSAASRDDHKLCAAQQQPSTAHCWKCSSTCSVINSGTFNNKCCFRDSLKNSRTIVHKHKSRWKTNKFYLVHRYFSCHSSMFNFFNISLYLFTLVSCSIPYVQAASNPFDMWENEITLDSNSNHRNFVVQWTPSEDRIVFRITARTRGYIGFGFHSKPQMDGADIVVG